MFQYATVLLGEGYLEGTAKETPLYRGVDRKKAFTYRPTDEKEVIEVQKITSDGCVVRSYRIDINGNTCIHSEFHEHIKEAMENTLKELNSTLQNANQAATFISDVSKLSKRLIDLSHTYEKFKGYSKDEDVIM